MSKIKWSFSLILAIFLVGILSTAAFAKDPYSFKPVQNGMGLYIPFTGNSADSADVPGKSFSLIIKGPDNYAALYGPVALDTNKKGSFNIPASDLKPGVVYNLELWHSSDDLKGVSGIPLSKSTGVVIDSHNDKMLNTNDPTTKINAEGETIRIDKDGSGLLNENATGFNNTRKQRSGQKVHGFYTNNTNSCASCHQTHTAANGEALLFKDGVYSTCSACHDGTTGAYNSFAPATAETPEEIAGTFDVKTEGHNGSLHEADGSLQVSAAPGGNINVDANSTSKVTWGQEFDCASCHAAHGSGTSAENNLNLDPMGWAQVAYSTANKDTQNGKLFKDLTVMSSAPTASTPFSTPFIVAKVNSGDSSKNFFYNRAKVPSNSDVIQTFRWDGKKYVADYSLWLRDKGHVNAPLSNADTFFKDASSTDITNTMTVVWKDGFAFGAGVSNVDKAQIAIGIDVETTNNIQTLFDSTVTGYVPDSGLQMSRYCTSCHTDYLSTTRTNDTGVYTTAHRHATAQDRLTCVRCHFAHGSEAQIMKDANDQTYFEKVEAGMTPTAALDYLKDPNPSSALKRYTGMAVCYACHGQGEQFLGNPNNKERPVSGQPGSVRGSNY
ncbi:cytochrome c3 family protein [Neobacillus cucumis]|uniref:cytochrome c3 family protein n=1 Tax=Neobacillus cucumis TaxID=1740721 RepID=UPI0018E01E6F|nr:cytochrome c3 family protein [Neobacillus cucumis]MBI0577699.1 cytochrome c3 family protein [Neobacillus cucumis]